MPTKNIYNTNLACFIAMLMWAIGFPALEILLETWGSITLTFLRFLISIIILYPIWFIIEGKDGFINLPLRQSFLIGFFGWGISAVMFVIGQKLSDAVTPTICAAMMPIFGAIIEVLLDKNKLKLNLLLGLFLALLGGFLATGIKLSDGRFGLGAVICLIAVFMFAWSTRATSKKIKNVSFIGQTTLTMTGATFSMCLIFFISYLIGYNEVSIGIVDSKNLILLFIFIVISLTLSQTIWIWASEYLGITLASFHCNAVPFYVMIIIVVLFGERWDWLQALGAFFVALGVFIAQKNTFNILSKEMINKN